MDLLLLSDLAQRSEALLSSALANPGPLTLGLVFAGGALTSLGPCSLSLLPVTLAYLAGYLDAAAMQVDRVFDNGQPQTGTLNLADIACPVEPFEEMGDFLGRNPYALVRYLKSHAPFRRKDTE